MKISVIITTRNRSTMLRQAIESVLEQEASGAFIELIVVDDDSSDNTEAVVAEYSDVRHVRTKQGTAAGSRNVGIGEASGEWIAFLDDDDVWLPPKLKTCVEVISKNPQARLVYTAGYVCDHELNGRYRLWHGPKLSSYRNDFEAFLDHVLTPSMFLLHREVFDKIGLFDVSVPRAEDRELICRTILGGFEFASSPEPLILYRQRELPDSEMIHSTYLMTMAVMKRYMSKKTPLRPSLRRRLSILRRIRGCYTCDLLEAACKQERKGLPKSVATHARRMALKISPLHYLRNMRTRF